MFRQFAAAAAALGLLAAQGCAAAKKSAVRPSNRAPGILDLKRSEPEPATAQPYLSPAVTPPPENASGLTHVSERTTLEKVREDIVRLGRLDWTKTREASSEVLLSLSDLLPSGANTVKPVAEIRFQAERLKRGDSLSSPRAGWIKAALIAALDGLQAGGPSHESLSRWIRDARQAVDGIDRDSSPAFQRAAIQDGLRATLDAFTFAAELQSLCSSSAE